jgi:hypothetical protein
MSAARLKKKEVETKTLKRKNSWIDKMHKSRKKGSKKGGKKKETPTKVCDNTTYILFSFTVFNGELFNYIFYLKEQETAKKGGKKRGGAAGAEKQKYKTLL